jgi:multicomponent Na+:H+ antiporter subunit G
VSEVLVSLLVVLGAGMVLLASLGLVRLPDLYTRMHASTKPATLGTSLVVAALAIHAGELGIGARALLIVLFFLLTAPVAAHRLAHAAYRAGVRRWPGTVRDDLEAAAAPEAEGDGDAGGRRA